MSWDIFVQDLPAGITSTEEIPNDFRPGIIGKSADIVARIKEVVPSADFTRPSWGTIDGQDYSIEINIGEEEYLRSFALHVRGGNSATIMVANILNHLGLRALDPGSESGLFTSATEAEASLQKWRGYRDQAVEKS